MNRAALGLLLASCTSAVPIEDYPCPDGGTQLTYESFGREFFEANCNRCHSAGEGLRHGAPASFRFDTLDGVHQHADRIFVRAATTNTSMPPGPDDPASDDRERLAE